MKKLFVAVAVAIVATFAHAATYNWTWGVSATGLIMIPGTTAASAETLLNTGTAYLFADLTSQQLKDMVSDFAAGTYTASGYEQTSSVANGTISKVNWNDSRTTGTSVDWTMVVVATVDEKDYLFISDSLTKSRQADGKNTKITYDLMSTSMLAVKDASAGYTSSGWYGAVPEPTSGLLVMLGVGLMALRRRRA